MKQVRHQHGLTRRRSNIDQIRIPSYTHHGAQRRENELIKDPRDGKSFASDKREASMKADQSYLNPNTDSRHLGNGKRERRNRWRNSDKHEDKVDNKSAMLRVIDMGTHNAGKDPLEPSEVPHNITGNPNEPPPVTTSHRQLNGFTSIPQRFFKIPKSEKEMKALVKDASRLNICLERTSYMEQNPSKGEAHDKQEKIKSRLLARLCINEVSTSNAIRKEQALADPLTSNSIPEPSPTNPTSKLRASSISGDSKSDGSGLSALHMISSQSSAKRVLSNQNMNNSAPLSNRGFIKTDNANGHATDILLRVCSGETSVLKLTKSMILDAFDEIRHVECWQADTLAKLYEPFCSSANLALNSPIPISNDMLSDVCSLNQELVRNNCFSSPDVPHTSAWPLDPPPKTERIIPTTTTHARDMFDTYPFFKENRARLEWENDILFY